MGATPIGKSEYPHFVERGDKSDRLAIRLVPDTPGRFILGSAGGERWNSSLLCLPARLRRTDVWQGEARLKPASRSKIGEWIIARPLVGFDPVQGKRDGPCRAGKSRSSVGGEKGICHSVNSEADRRCCDTHNRYVTGNIAPADLGYSLQPPQRAVVFPLELPIIFAPSAILLRSSGRCAVIVVRDTVCDEFTS